MPRTEVGGATVYYREWGFGGTPALGRRAA
jgi:hypothetical protein